MFEPSGYLPVLAVELSCRHKVAVRSGLVRFWTMVGKNLSIAQLNCSSLSKDDGPSRVNERLSVEVSSVLPILAGLSCHAQLESSS